MLTKMSRLIVSLLLIIPIGVLAGNEQYIQSKIAKMYRTPSFNAAVLMEISKGQTVEVIEKQSQWVKVKHANKTGWVSLYLVSKTRPIDKESLLSGTSKTDKKNVRRRASGINDVAATRGLREDEDNSIDKNKSPDYSALEKVEAIKIDDKEIETFHEQKAE